MDAEEQAMRDAFDAFCAEQASWIDYHIRKMRHRPEERDDLRQDIMLLLWRTWSRYDPERCTHKNWVWLKTREAAQKNHKSVANRPLYTVGLMNSDGSGEADDDEANGHEQEAMAASCVTGEQEVRAWKSERLAACRRALSDVEYGVLHSLWVEGMELPEVAARLSLDPGLARTIKVRSLQRLKKSRVIDGWGEWGL